MDWGGANSRFLGLVSVWATRSFDQTALRPSVIKRIRQIDVKYITHITSFCDPTLKLLNEDLTSDIQKHKQGIWKEHLDAHWDQRHSTHTLWKTIHGLSNRAPPHTLNTSIIFNNKIATTPKHIANCFIKQFTNTQHTKQTDT